MQPKRTQSSPQKSDTELSSESVQFRSNLQTLFTSNIIMIFFCPRLCFPTSLFAFASLPTKIHAFLPLPDIFLVLIHYHMNTGVE